MAITDGEEGQNSLPDSVDRVFGQALERSNEGAVFDKLAVEKVRSHIAAIGVDSNLDRIMSAYDVDVLCDGAIAAEAVLSALERRFTNPVSANETLRLIPVVR